MTPKLGTCELSPSNWGRVIHFRAWVSRKGLEPSYCFEILWLVEVRWTLVIDLGQGRVLGLGLTIRVPNHRRRVTQKIFKLWNNLLVLDLWVNQTCKKRWIAKVLCFTFFDFILVCPAYNKNVKENSVAYIRSESTQSLSFTQLWKMIILIDFFCTSRFIPMDKLTKQYHCLQLSIIQSYSISLAQLYMSGTVIFENREKTQNKDWRPYFALFLSSFLATKQMSRKSWSFFYVAQVRFESVICRLEIQWAHQTKYWTLKIVPLDHWENKNK